MALAESSVEYQESTGYYINEVFNELGLFESFDTILNIAHNLNYNVPVKIVDVADFDKYDIRAVVEMPYHREDIGKIRLADLNEDNIIITIPVNVPPEYIKRKGILLFSYIEEFQYVGIYQGGLTAHRTINDIITVDFKSGKSLNRYRKIVEPRHEINKENGMPFDTWSWQDLVSDY
jgi:hypothetical protein